MSPPCRGCADRARRHARPGRIVCYTAGVFDLLHAGHLNLLRESARWGDLLVVGVVSDAGTAAYKGRRPVQDEATRLAVVRALEVVDFAVLQPTTDPTPVLEMLRPAVMTHGSDWDRLREGHASLERLGVKYVTIPYTDGVSTTLLRERMVAG